MCDFVMGLCVDLPQINSHLWGAGVVTPRIWDTAKQIQRGWAKMSAIVSGQKKWSFIFFQNIHKKIKQRSKRKENDFSQQA